MQEREEVGLGAWLEGITDAERRADAILRVRADRRQASELRLKHWTLYSGLVAGAIALLSLSIQSCENSRARQKDLSVKFYEKQLDAYLRVCKTLSKVPRTRGTPELISEIEDLLIADVWPLGDRAVSDPLADLLMVLVYEEGGEEALNRRRRTSKSLSRKTRIALMWETVMACRSSLRKAFPDIEIGGLPANAWLSESVSPR